MKDRTLQERLLLSIAHRVARRLPDRVVLLDYPVHQSPRYGWGQPPHARLKEILDQSHGSFSRRLAQMLEFADAYAELSDLDDAAVGGGSPLRTQWLAGVDSLVLYATIRMVRPPLYVEVGSGVSTVITRRASSESGSPTTILSIDPQPRKAVDALCDEVIRSPLEDVDLGVFDRLAAGDVLFVDNSHRSLMNSDVTVFFLEVLPRLAPGVLVHIHDIFLPYDYPPGWASRGYSEQYLLATALLTGAQTFETVFASQYAVRDPRLNSQLDQLWERPELHGVPRDGGSYWIRTR